MPRTGSSLGAFLLAALLAAFAQAAAADSGPGPQAIMARMAEATRTLNYEGTFVYSHENRLETVRVIHAFQAGRVRERLIHLNGTPREVLRDESGVTCIYPDARSVVVERSPAGEALQPAKDMDVERLAPHYRLTLGATSRIAGRDAQEVAIDPRDGYRYGYRLWVDRDSGLLLRSDLLDREGGVLEQILFVTLEVREEIPDSALEPTIGVKGWSWFDESGRSYPEQAADEGWSAHWLPPGFEPTTRSIRRLQRVPGPVRYLGYSDGLASVSVYVQEQGAADEGGGRVASLGAAHAYTVAVDGHQVTVVGEVPAETVERVATSVRRTTGGSRDD
ncbi:MAG: MucB/RseB C-terminal domain-containing protein [Gammaproteobacteria bacterium]|jgi:sigma-E factor negative regulatory protein RseB|nr:MucB/RseB C-terminal domain-containing protein [Gammaproteobacteria bacterium]